MGHSAPPPVATAFFVGLGVRLFGTALIWLADGSDHLFRKILVVIGVVLAIGGMGVLRYLLFRGLGKKRQSNRVGQFKA